MHLQDFEPLIWFSILATEIFLAYLEIDDDQSDKIDIKEFMKYVIDHKWNIENCFREYHVMDAKKIGYIGFNGFFKF